MTDPEIEEFLTAVNQPPSGMESFARLWALATNASPKIKAILADRKAIRDRQWEKTPSLAKLIEALENPHICLTPTKEGARLARLELDALTAEIEELRERPVLSAPILP